MSSRISGFKNKEQEQKLISEYKDNLAQQISNNEKRSIDNSEYFPNQKLGINPVAPQAKTAAEELLDQTLQNETAYKNLRTIMKDADAAAALGRLQHDGDVETFNSFWGKFKKEVEGTAFVYPAFFNAIWERFKEKLAKTNDTGIHISAEAEDFEVLKDRVTHFREMLLDNFDTTDNQNKAIVSALTTLLTYGRRITTKRTTKFLNQKSQLLREIFKKSQMLSQKYPPKTKMPLKGQQNIFLEKQKQRRLKERKRKAAKDLEKRRLQMEKEEEEKKQFQEADDAYDELMKKNIGTLYKLFWEVKEKNTNFTYIDPKGMRKMLTEKKLENKEYGRELIDYIVYKTFGFNPKAPSKKKTSGTGFALKGKSTRNVMYERG